MRTSTPRVNYLAKPEPVLTKADFVRRYAAGEFGNASPTWESYTDWGSSYLLRGTDGLYHVRNKVAGGKTWYNLRPCEVYRAWYNASEMYGEGQLYISEMAPTHLTLIQGEVQRSERYIDLRYTMVRKPMRDALAEGEYSVSGIIAVSLLRRYLWGPSLDWLWYLLDAYDGHVVEFSAYDREWGTVPGYNTVYWEVRCGY